MPNLASLITAPLAAAPLAGTASAADIETVWDFVVKGGVVMIPIGLCSLVAVTVVVERAWSLRRRAVAPPSFAAHVRKVLDSDGPEAAVRACRADGTPIANVFAAALRRRSASVEALERHVQEAGQREVAKLRRYLRVLSVIAAVAPLLGLLGTIFGMIKAFQTVATSADALGRTELLAEGIYEAMITTAAGLIVAIPALLSYHWLCAKVQGHVVAIDQAAVDLVESLIEAPSGREHVAARSHGTQAPVLVAGAG